MSKHVVDSQVQLTDAERALLKEIMGSVVNSKTLPKFSPKKIEELEIIRKKLAPQLTVVSNGKG